MWKLMMAALTVVFVVTGIAVAANIEDIPWTESNATALRTFDRQAVEEFVNRVADDAVQHRRVGEFTWADLGGDGRYGLVVTADTTGRAFFEGVDVYQRDIHGKVVVQSFLGGGVRDLSKVVRDLDGDGKVELVIPSRLDTEGPGGAFYPTVIWPKVYRLRKGKYVAASRDFPRFYDSEVLPGLDEAIAEARQTLATQPERQLPSTGDPEFLQHAAEACLPQRRLASLEMTKDKILRVLGRDATAGLSRAREWVANADPCLVGEAVTVLTDIGGHKDDLRAAEKEAQKSSIEFQRTGALSRYPRG